jgi:hypothetical protein
VLIESGCIVEARHQLERARALAAGTALAPQVEDTGAQIEAAGQSEQCRLPERAWPD